MTNYAGLLGRRYAAPAETLDRDRHRAYAAAVTGGRGSQSRRPLACFASVYLLGPVVAQLFAEPELQASLRNLLHGEQEFWFDRPLEFGEVLTPQGTVTRAEERRGMAFLELTCHGRDQAGGNPARSRSLFVIRTQP